MQIEDNIDEIMKKLKKRKRLKSNIRFYKRNKKYEEEDKKAIIEALWSIIYSDEKADMYETNLMRRISGLLIFR